MGNAGSDEAAAFSSAYDSVREKAITPRDYDRGVALGSDRYEPMIMPSAAAARPASCGGTTACPVFTNSAPSQAAKPAAIAQSAPRVVARFQKRPANSGTNAATSVTL